MLILRNFCKNDQAINLNPSKKLSEIHIMKFFSENSKIYLFFRNMHTVHIFLTSFKKKEILKAS